MEITNKCGSCKEWYERYHRLLKRWNRINEELTIEIRILKNKIKLKNLKLEEEKDTIKHLMNEITNLKKEKENK